MLSMTASQNAIGEGQCLAYEGLGHTVAYLRGRACNGWLLKGLHKAPKKATQEKHKREKERWEKKTNCDSYRDIMRPYCAG